MRCLLLPLVDESAWLALPDAERERRTAAYPQYGAALKGAGALVGSYRPQPSPAAKTVRVSDGQTEVRDGPHAGGGEQLGGVYIIDVADLDAALAWAARCPAAAYGVVEVRPLS